MEIRWTKLPFTARNMTEFNTELTKWLSWVFYDELPTKGFEVREEQIYTAFRMARALGKGETLMAEAGPGTGKTFAYLLPAICYARFKGAPVVVASASAVLRAQLIDPEGDIHTLSRLLGLEIDARAANDPGEFLCELKAARPDMLFDEDIPNGWQEFKGWAEKTGTGARHEVPHVGDELWDRLAWDPGLPCDTCNLRGHCHVMTARRHYRAAPDLVVCDHRLFSLDLLTRQERQEGGELPFLPAYSAAVLDEGHHVAETWQRVQGHSLTPRKVNKTLESVSDLTDRAAPARALRQARAGARKFFSIVQANAEPGERKRALNRTPEVLEIAKTWDKSLEVLQDELVTEEAMSQGLDLEIHLKAYQARLDEVRAALRLFLSPHVVSWVEEQDLWAVPKDLKPIFGKGRLSTSMPVIFSSATLEADYTARLLGVTEYGKTQVGVPFDLGEQALVYQSPADGDEIFQVVDVIRASKGRALVLLNSLAEVQRYKTALAKHDLPYQLLFEGDGDRGAMLEEFRADISSVAFGASFWEGVDVPGEALSCCIIPKLPYPEHDPLIRERRRLAEAQGHDPFEAVDLPEMIMKLKQGAGRLIRSAADRGALALLDRSHLGEEWADQVDAALPEDSERTSELRRITEFLGEG